MAERFSLPDDVDLTKYAWNFQTHAEFDADVFAGIYDATIGPIRVSDAPFDLTYIDWYHDFGFRRRVRFTGVSDDGLTYSLDYVDA